MGDDFVAEKEKLDRITNSIISGAIRVHRSLGPGLLESAYDACLSFELVDCGHSIERQKSLPVAYRSVLLDCGYRIDLLVDSLVIVELKSVDKLLPIHEAQLLSYLKLSGCKVGLLINFNERIVKNGIRRIVNDFPDAQRSRRSLR